jgi:hypothetical protein
MYDPVIGRWIVPDPMRQYFSPYLAMGNNPVFGVDPDGGEAETQIANLIHYIRIYSKVYLGRHLILQLY